MKFIYKEVPVIPTSVAKSLSQSADNDAHALILTDIINDIIQVTKFTRDINDEVCALMDYCDVPSPVAIDSMEFVTAMYWIALLKGVQLGTQDIEIIIDNLRYYVVVSGDYVEITGERGKTTEVCQ